MKREWVFFVYDINDAIKDIKKFVGAMNLKQFLSDEKTRCAVAFKIENIGEASKNIPKEVRAKYRDLPWTDMARMRDKIAHYLFRNQLQSGPVGCQEGIARDRAVD